MKNPLASLKKLSKKEVAIFGGILAVMLIFFVVRKQGGGGGESTPYYMAGDSNETRNQLADMQDQSNSQIVGLKDTISSQNTMFQDMFAKQSESNAEALKKLSEQNDEKIAYLQESHKDSMLSLKDSFNDIVSYVGGIQNSIPDYSGVFAGYDQSLNNISEQNRQLQDMINDNNNRVSPSPPPVNKPSTPPKSNGSFSSGSYNDKASAEKLAKELQSSYGGKNTTVVKEGGVYRVKSEFDSSDRANAVGDRVKDRGLLGTYYTGKK